MQVVLGGNLGDHPSYISVQAEASWVDMNSILISTP